MAAAATAAATNGADEFSGEDVRIPTKEEYIEMVTVDMKAYLRELNLDQPRSPSTNPPADPLGLSQSGVSSIFRVGPDVRHRDKISAYDPQIISIGPYHSYKKELRVFQELKWVYLKKLLDRSPNHNRLETYIKAIGNCEKQARECYSDEVPDRNFCELVDVLVLDGCFILEILLEHSHPEGIKGPITAAKWNLRQLYHDLLLLENQIPFFVLERIFDNTTIAPAPGNPQPLLSLMDLALHYIMSRGDVFKSGGDHVVNFNNNHPKIYHLLHLSYLSVLQGLIDDFKPQPSTSFVTDVLVGIRKLICSMPCSFFSEKKRDTFRLPRSIPTATELQIVGVHFLTKKGATSYINVSFVNRKMEMALLYMQPESFSDFYNLLAFEQGCSAMDNKFTSYVVFMNNIVNTVEDVSLLRTSGILEFARCNDSEVAELFNNLGSTAYLDFENHYLGQLFKDVMEYYEQDRHKWRRTMTRLLYGAGLIILLTVISTVFTVISYFKS